jgi:RHS repeat-associated protein
MGTPIDFGLHNDQNIIVQTTYDKGGRVTAMRDPAGHQTTYTYDQLNRRTSLTDPLGNVWQTRYSTLTDTLETTLTDPLGNITQQIADRMGRPSAVQYLGESPKLTPDVTYIYDKSGNRTLMSEWSAPNVAVHSTSFTYDQARRVRQVAFDTNGDGTPEQAISYDYDAGGLRTRMTLPGDLSLSYSYDERGQLTSLTDWDNQPTSYAYDKAGRLSSISRSNDVDSSYQYDPAGRLRLLRHTAGTKLLGHYQYTVDGRGNRTKAYEVVARGTPSATLAYNDPAVDYYRGTWTNAAPLKVSTNTSAALRIAFANDFVTLTLGTGPDHGLCDILIDGDLWNTVDNYAASDGTHSFTISMQGNFGSHLLDIRNRTEKNRQSSGYKLRFQSLALQGQAFDWQTLRYGYDALSRLQTADVYAGKNTGVTPTRQYAYAYDTAGNRTGQVVTVGGVSTSTDTEYNAANRIARSRVDGGSWTDFTYDAAGRLTNDGISPYTWDRANRLLSYNGPAYQYDGEGRRIQQTVGLNATNYLNDVTQGLWKMVAATTGADTTRYVHGPTGISQQHNPDDSWRWMLKDGLGSVRQLVDESAVGMSSQLYEPYGASYGEQGSEDSVFKFTGEPMDGNKLVQLRARYLNPILGVFTSLDPLDDFTMQPLLLNRYSYVGSNTINLIDPSGLYWWGQHDKGVAPDLLTLAVQEQKAYIGVRIQLAELTTTLPFSTFRHAEYPVNPDTRTKDHVDLLYVSQTSNIIELYEIKPRSGIHGVSSQIEGFEDHIQRGLNLKAYNSKNTPHLIYGQPDPLAVSYNWNDRTWVKGSIGTIPRRKFLGTAENNKAFWYYGVRRPGLVTYWYEDKKRDDVTQEAQSANIPIPSVVQAWWESQITKPHYPSSDDNDENGDSGNNPPTWQPIIVQNPNKRTSPTASPIPKIGIAAITSEMILGVPRSAPSTRSQVDDIAKDMPNDSYVEWDGWYIVKYNSGQVALTDTKSLIPSGFYPIIIGPSGGIVGPYVPGTFDSIPNFFNIFGGLKFSLGLR